MDPSEFEPEPGGVVVITLVLLAAFLVGFASLGLS